MTTPLTLAKAALEAAKSRLLDVEWNGYDTAVGERVCPCCEEMAYQGKRPRKHGYACGLEASIAEVTSALAALADAEHKGNIAEPATEPKGSYGLTDAEKAGRKCGTCTATAAERCAMSCVEQTWPRERDPAPQPGPEATKPERFCHLCGRRVYYETCSEHPDEPVDEEPVTGPEKAGGDVFGDGVCGRCNRGGYNHEPSCVDSYASIVAERDAALARCGELERERDNLEKSSRLQEDRRLAADDRLAAAEAALRETLAALCDDCAEGEG